MSDTTWTKDNLYIVNRELEVRAALTIEAGTTVCFGTSIQEAGGLFVSPYGPGALDVQGTSAEHVTFTATDAGKGWNGIVGEGGLEKLSIAFTDFYYASRHNDGNDHFSRGAVRVGDARGDAPPARLHHVTFSGLKRGGAVWVTSNAGLTPDSVIEVKSFNLSQDELEYVDPVVLVTLNAAQSLAPGMVVIAPEIPESKAGVELLRRSMHGSCVVPAIDVPYLAPEGVFIADTDGGGSDPVTLTIAAGAQIRMGWVANVDVGGENLYAGNLIVDGTAEKPVVFSFYPFPESFSPGTGWGAIVFNRHEPAVSRLSHAILQNAGEGITDVDTACNESETGAIVLNAPSLSDYVGLPIDHTTIDGSASNGIVAECSFDCIDAATDYQDPALGNTFVDVAGAAQILSTCPSP